MQKGDSLGDLILNFQQKNQWLLYDVTNNLANKRDIRLMIYLGGCLDKSGYIVVDNKYTELDKVYFPCFGTVFRYANRFSFLW
ncbi:hypothetical protein [Borrelia sp. RT1S]|uniref:hypothetical protein n=1 Tax=Borrelia sp. RT1S TaxID=2898580 RepID=UPI001E45067D|nr:hypothetical protein [Borrelia sp. RT1S]UGQ17781.1 hypothetical protein LSO05_04970 [Borrelia sp. RT1S]